jgi:MarR family transcriptional regulator, lower aerobic nicotinate degradation pathway regulator
MGTHAIGPSLNETTSILDDLRRVVRSLRESSREAERRLGVSGAQLFVLQSLADGPALSLNELAARTRTHQSTVSVVVSKLVERALLTRSTSSEDARRIELAVTKRGLALLGRAPHAAQDGLITGIERLPRTQQKALAEALRALVVAMRLDGAEPEMFFEGDSAALEKKGPKRRVAP